MKICRETEGNKGNVEERQGGIIRKRSLKAHTRQKEENKESDS